MRLEQRWHLAGFASGVALGLADYVALELAGADVRLAGRDVTAAVMGFYALSFGALGWALGRLAQARQRIARQLAELEASRRAAIENEKLAAIGRLAAGVAHEVRNPLAVIRSSASMVQEGFQPGDDSHRALGFIVEETDRLNGLITALLGFARPARIDRRPTPAERVVERAIHLANDVVAARRVSVERDASSLRHLTIDGDPDLLAQVVLGLVVNAAEAMEEGGRVRICGAGDGEGVAIEVADSGPGVSDEVRGKLFEPFVTTKASGTGLGLPMAAKIVHAHGGTIDLVPGAGLGHGGAGACFRLRLPAAREVAA